jgi:hypothetical protein
MQRGGRKCGTNSGTGNSSKRATSGQLGTGGGTACGFKYGARQTWNQWQVRSKLQACHFASWPEAASGEKPPAVVQTAEGLDPAAGVEPAAFVEPFAGEEPVASGSQWPSWT